jgi:hypothetical protein
MWPALKQSGVWNCLYDGESERRYWARIYQAIFDGTLKTSWDYQWQLARWSQSGLSVVPNVNLVSNIGFGGNATHTTWEWNPLARLPTDDIGEILHPPFVVRHREADAYMFRNAYGPNPLRRALRRAKHWRSSWPAQ